MVKFSLAHTELKQEEYAYVFYELLKNTPQSTIDDIEDIYFGKFFRYKYDGVDKKYGNCMSVEATDEAIDYLFKIQDEFGVTISLTMNELNIPGEMQMNDYIINEFLDWIGAYYDRGLRSITLANTHLVKSGKIRKRFPLMRIKNTVNHLVSDAQQVVDYAHLGYNTILLDRSLNRNFTELRKIKKAVDMLNSKEPKFKLKTSLLAKESCLYKCPFKQEHDTIGAVIGANYFSTLSAGTCDNWRHPAFSALPRNGVNLYSTYSDTFEELSKYVDILKFSGRLGSIKLAKEDIIKYNAKFAWSFDAVANIGQNAMETHAIPEDNLLIAETFSEVIEHNAAPIHEWQLSYVYGDTSNVSLSPKRYQYLYDKYLKDTVWFSKIGRELELTLQNCKSQCWDCHKCEEAYGLDHIDSALQLNSLGLK